VPYRPFLRNSGAGQSLVEFAFALPVLLLLLLGIIDLGRGFYIREQVSDSARAALRTALAASEQGTANAACGLGGKVTVTLPASGSSIGRIADAAAIADSPTGAPADTKLAGATLTITWHCAGGVAVTSTTNGGITDPADSRSDSVDVVVQYPLALLFPTAEQAAGPSVTVAAHEIGRVEY